MKEPNHPELHDVKAYDLFHLSRCEELYGQAIDAGIISETESSALNFLSAALRPVN